jgi:hypothetical protein
VNERDSQRDLEDKKVSHDKQVEKQREVSEQEARKIEQDAKKS